MYTSNGFFKRLGGHFEWNAECNHGVTELLLDTAAIIATYLKTRYAGKSYGGYNIYEDDKVIVDVDTYVPNVAVRVKRGDTDELVLHFNYNGFAQTFKPGKWQASLEALRPLAEEKYRAAQLEHETEMQRLQERDFGPIDDSDVFATD